MKRLSILVVVISILTMLTSITLTFHPNAFENWRAVKTQDLANEPIENYQKVEKEGLIKIIQSVTEYNTKYVSGAEKRISDLKALVLALCGCILLLLGLFLFKIIKEKDV